MAADHSSAVPPQGGSERNVTGMHACFYLERTSRAQSAARKPPSCSSQAVEELLGALGGDGGLLVQLPSWHYADPLLPAGATSLPLRDALSRCYDLRQPKPELLRLLHAKLSAAVAAQQQPPRGLTAANGAANGVHGATKPKGRSAKADSASELSMGGHDALCAGGCVADKLEVGMPCCAQPLLHRSASSACLSSLLLPPGACLQPCT